MVSMSTDHSDIDNFIDSKKDTDKITHANISVRANDKFFKNKENKATLRKIAQNNWETAEPGMLFWDRVEEWHLLSHHPEYILKSTNPCFTGDMKLLTSEGYRRFDELSGKSVELINANGEVSRGKVWETGVKDTNIIRLSNGVVIKSTPDHVFKTLDGKEVEAKDLKGQKLTPYDKSEDAPTVVEIIPAGKQTVYDFNEPLTNWGVVEGYIAHNCGEQPLPGGSSCLLGSINLSEFVLDPFTSQATIDYEELKKAVQQVTIGMNEVLDEGIELHPLEIQREMAKEFRQIGIGIMGLADLFIKLGITYGSKESIELSHKLGQTIRDTAILESVELAKKYGPYPKYNYGYIKQSKYYQSLPADIQLEIEKYGMRNSHLLSIAPTGSISTMLGVSGGIEPIFANSFMRTTKSLSGGGDVRYKVYAEVIQDLMNAKGIVDEQDLPNYCVTSHDIKPIDRIKLQAAWQDYIDSAISSTINLHEETTVEEIEDIYYNAWEHGLKGVTVYRDNCFRTGILEVEDDEPNKFECPECGEDLNMAEGCNECPSCGWGQCSI